jgi:hypothetical protein
VPSLASNRSKWRCDLATWARQTYYAFIASRSLTPDCVPARDDRVGDAAMLRPAGNRTIAAPRTRWSDGPSVPRLRWRLGWATPARPRRPVPFSAKAEVRLRLPLRRQGSSGSVRLPTTVGDQPSASGLDARTRLQPKPNLRLLEFAPETEHERRGVQWVPTRAGYSPSRLRLPQHACSSSLRIQTVGSASARVITSSSRW